MERDAPENVVPTTDDGPQEATGARSIGLERRMRLEGRRISSQHRQLDDFHDAVRSALDAGTVHTAREAFTRFQDAAEAHLSLEEELYFPALRTLQPTLRSQLDQIRSEHDGLRDRMRQIGVLLAANEGKLSSDRLWDLAIALAAHEEREEALVASIVHAGPPGD